MKVNVDLSSANNVGSGIATFENEIVSRLARYTDFELHGCANSRRNVSAKDFVRFPFATTLSVVPYSFVYAHSLPISYELMMHSSADVNFFGTYAIPKVSYKKPVVSTIHDIILQKVNSEPKEIIDAYDNKIRHTIEHSTEILTVSNATKNDLVEYYGISPDIITVAYNGVDYNKFSLPCSEEKQQKVRAKYNLPRKYILYFGAIRKHKNVDGIVKAYALLPSSVRDEYKLVITKENDNLLDLANKLGIDKDVVFTKFIDEEDKVAIYQMGYMSIFVSFYEGFGIPIIESMAAGTPVVCSNTSSMPEAGGDSAFLVNPYDIQSISDGMLKFVEDKDFYQSKRISGKEHAKKFNWDTSAQIVYSLLRRVAE